METSAAPSLPTRLAIFGAGGFGREVAWLASEVMGVSADLSFVVDRPEYLSAPVNEVPVRLLSDLGDVADTPYVVALGDPQLRRRAANSCEARGLIATSLVHPRVKMSRWVEVAPGAVICAGTIITTNVVIGRHVHVNLDCTIGHDAVIGEFATLSPGVHVSGNVVIEPGAFIGTGASIINGLAGKPLVIGDGSVVAAGACVTKPVDPGALVAGVPAVRKR
jgi:sugar O-acyltransferase (sialic acid O-acetyltransferase NeuD family)